MCRALAFGWKTPSSIACQQSLRRQRLICLSVALQAADYVPGSGIRVDNPFKHGVSAGLLLLDLAISRVPLISYHIQVR
jgi:hypothetical protein